MLQHFTSAGIQFAPGIVLALFAARILGEQGATIVGPTTPAGAIVITLVITVITTAWLRLQPLKQTWPTFLLLPYIFYPEANPEIALLVAGVAGIVWLQLLSWRRPQINVRCSLLTGALLTFAVFIGLYILTLATDVLTADNGEFQLIATKLGVAHPPGFPLYTIMAHLMTQLPLAALPAYKVNLLSAITSATTLVFVYLTVYRLTRHLLGSLTAVIALGTSTTFWAQATTANIRSLTALFAAVSIYLLIRYWEEATMAVSHLGGSKADRYLILFALIFSFGLTHHASLVFMGLIFMIFIMMIKPALLLMPSHWWRPFLAALCGLLPLLYLPWRGLASAQGVEVRGASVELASWEGFLNHVLALGFRGDFFYFAELPLLWQRIKVMSNVISFQFTPLIIVVMILGLVLLLRHHPRLAFLLGGSFVIHTLVTATYRAPQTVEYMLPAFIPAAICLGYGVGGILKAPLPSDNILLRALSQLLAAIALIVAVDQALHHYPSYAYLHQTTAARDYAQTILDQAPPGSVLLADWHWVTPLWYLQEVEGQRDDLTIHFVFPTDEPYAVTWARRIAEAYNTSSSVIATHFDENAYASLPPPEPIGEAFLFRQEPRTNLPPTFTPLDVALNNTLYILGYQLSAPTAEIGQEVVLTLAWEPIDELPEPVSLFAHLVGYDDRLYAQQDVPAQPQEAGITLTQFRLTPRLGTAPGEFTLMIGAYTTTPLPGPDGQLRTPIATLSVEAMTWPPVTNHPVYRTTAGERPLLRLVGYDWDNTLPGSRRLYLHWQTEQGYQTEVLDNEATEALSLPAYLGPWGILTNQWSAVRQHRDEHYVPFGQGIIWMGSTMSNDQSLAAGEVVSLPQTFYSSRPIIRDLVVSVRLIGYEDDGFNWAWWHLNDTVPAMGAIPTLKWIRGSRVRDPHMMQVDLEAQADQPIGATLRLYDAFTNRPLPILDERIVAQFPWVPLGQTVLDQ